MFEWFLNVRLRDVPQNNCSENFRKIARKNMSLTVSPSTLIKVNSYPRTILYKFDEILPISYSMEDFLCLCLIAVN